jgi:murein DD-endopeptidase MepM/ murein hydrolase activator NlpD
MRRFPIEGPVTFQNDWGVARPGGRTHHGTDIFAAEGARVVAVDAGLVRFDVDPLGGNVAYLRADDGTTYYYAHLSRYEGADRRVATGEAIGYVGRTGNAAHTAPHLHFEVHPAGGAAVNPYPLLTIAPRGSASALKLLWLTLPAAMSAGAYAVARAVRRRRRR